MGMEPSVLRIIVERHYELAKPGPSTHRLKSVPDERVFLEEGLCLKPLARPCEECGDSVEDRRLTYALKYYRNTNPHWVRKCSGCGKKCPVSRPFDNP